MVHHGIDRSLIPTLDGATFERAMDRFVKKVNKDPHHRGLSWNHAHEAWVAFEPGNTAYEEHMALHLAFYLASWGMYRGSAPSPVVSPAFPGCTDFHAAFRRPFSAAPSGSIPAVEDGERAFTGSGHG